MNLYTVKSFPDNGMVQTEGRLARRHERHVLHGAVVFRALTLADVMWAIRESLPMRIGARRVGETWLKWKGVDCVTTRVETKG